MSFIPVAEYGIGLIAFGIGYWLLNGILPEMSGMATRGDLFDLLHYFWVAIVIIYVLFGGFWLVRKYNERYPGRI